MKNQYFGDVNDYRKYGLLRCLQKVTKLPLGVCWLLTINDGRNDGEHRRYLEDESSWRRFDAPLYDSLSRLRNQNVTRDVKNANDWNILPGTDYFNECLEVEIPRRENFFNRVWEQMANRPLLFFDPDNGIEVPSAPRKKKRSLKHLYWDEITEAYKRRHSLVLYQHFPRRKRDNFIAETVNQIHTHLRAPVVAPYRTANVVFFLIIRKEHENCFQGVNDCILEEWPRQIWAANQAVGRVVAEEDGR